MRKNAWGKCVIIICIVIIAFMLNRILEKKNQENIFQDAGEVKNIGRAASYAPQVEEDNKLLKVFKEAFPEADPVLACEEDVTNDGCKDLVVIYRIKDQVRTVIVTGSEEKEKCVFSTPIPAPVENQKIQFKNIDKEDEIEIIITGEKKGAVGYAIYRMIDGEPVDLFGEGMEDCC